MQTAVDVVSAFGDFMQEFIACLTFRDPIRMRTDNRGLQCKISVRHLNKTVNTWSTLHSDIVYFSDLSPAVHDSSLY